MAHYPCLSQKAYQEFLKNLPAELQETLCKQCVEPAREHKKTINLTKYKEYSGIVLSRTSLKDECSQECPSAIVSIDTKDGKITIEAETGQDLKSLQTIITSYKKGVRHSLLNDLGIDKHIQDYLSTSNAEEKINSIFQDKNIGACLGKSKLYYYEDNCEEAKEILLETLYTKLKKYSTQQISLLQSAKSKKFIQELKKQKGCLVSLNVEGGVRVSGLKDMTKTCIKKIEQYLKDNHVQKEEVTIPQEKLLFIKRFSSQILEELKADSQTYGASVELEDNVVVLEGPQDFTDKAKDSLEALK